MPPDISNIMFVCVFEIEMLSKSDHRRANTEGEGDLEALEALARLGPCARRPELGGFSNFGVVALGPAGLAQDEDKNKITKSLHRKHTTCRHLA